MARFPEARLDQPHIDLYFVLRLLGYRGGLKSIEKQLGIERDVEVREVEGVGAIQLWKRYCQGDRKALDQLTQYNLADVENLVELLGIALGMMEKRREQ